jgi:hypothetical protein
MKLGKHPKKKGGVCIGLGKAKKKAKKGEE